MNILAIDTSVTAVTTVAVETIVTVEIIFTVETFVIIRDCCEGRYYRHLLQQMLL